MTNQESPSLIALRYWAALGAPIKDIAAALRRSEDEVADDLVALMSDPQPPRIMGYPSRVAWGDRTVTALLRRRLLQDIAEEREEPVVIVAGEGTLNVAEFRAAVALAASGLRAAGIAKGDRVAVDSTQRLESLIMVAAVLLVGAVVVRLSLSKGAEGVRAMLSAARPKMCFTTLADELGTAADGTVDVVSLSATGPELRSGFDGWLDNAPPTSDLPPIDVKPGDLALIGFTSGSTGVPKLVETSHLAVFRSSEAMAAMFGFDADDVFCTSTDFSALSAFRSMLTVPFLCGGKVLLPREQALTQPLALAQDCATHGVTRLTAIPNVLRGLALGANRLPKGSLAGLRTVFSGSGVLDQATRDSFHAAFGVPVIDYFGGREFATALYSRPESLMTVSSGGGVPCNCLVRIVDDEGRILPDGQTGEIMVHSDCLTVSDLAGSHPEWRGWHQTGDLGRVSGRDLVQVVGRRRDVIKAADGSLVFPAEVEALVNEVSHVRESCVLGWARGDGAEHIVAAVTLAGDGMASDIEDTVRAHVLSRVGRFLVPHHVIVVDGFPRIGTDKIDKAVLREQLAPVLAGLWRGEIVRDLV